MARATKLKVYRTPAGFYDAYVAAPSQKAAIEAWGSEHDLFARGLADLVTDPALTAEPLASPGVVIKQSRGTTKEQIAALADPEARAPTRQNDDDETKARGRKAAPRKAEQRTPAPRVGPKPSSADLEKAENALEAAKTAFDGEFRALAAREAELARERRTLEQKRVEQLRKAQAALDEQRQGYDTALRRWRDAKARG